MKKWVWVLIAVVGLIGVGLLYVSMQPSKILRPFQAGNSIDAGSTKTACQVFTDRVAKKVFGPSAKKSNAISNENQASTENIVVTNCSYETGKAIASVLVRGAKIPGAYSTNQFGFSSLKTQGSGGNVKQSVIAIKNLGDDAYYNTAYKQVNVLLQGGKYWLIVQVGQDRALAEALARELVKSF